MAWSWRIAKVAGIGIYIHVTFLLLLVWVGIGHFAQRHRWEDVWGGVAFIIVLFGIVVMHELGHALTAKRFGIQTRDITLLPIGGVARLDRMPDEPIQEFFVAIAGPAVNVVLAILLFAGLALTGSLTPFGQIFSGHGNFVSNLMAVNISLAVFNLVPAFPMDGGRVLRALLATRINYVRATQIAATTGQMMAFVFGFIGLFGPSPLGPNPLLIFIAVFVWMGAAQEAGLVQMKSVLGGIKVEQVMITDFRSLSPRDTLSRAVEHLLAGWQHDFPVVDDGRVVGVLTRAALVNGLAKRGAEAPVSEVMLQEFATVRPDESAERALTRLRTGNWQTMPVIGQGQLLGILTRENVGEFLMVQAALNGQPEAQKLGQRLAA